MSTQVAMYDAERGGAIWNERMSRDDGTEVATWMLTALREVATGQTETRWQQRTLELAYPEPADPYGGDAVFFGVASNVLIVMRDDFKAQLAEAKARGEEILPADSDDHRLVVVCSECLRASCWQTDFMCERSQGAATTERTVAELRKLGREDPRYWVVTSGSVMDLVNGGKS